MRGIKIPQQEFVLKLQGDLCARRRIYGTLLYMHRNMQYRANVNLPFQNLVKVCVSWLHGFKNKVC